MEYLNAFGEWYDLNQKWAGPAGAALPGVWAMTPEVVRKWPLRGLLALFAFVWACMTYPFKERVVQFSPEKQAALENLRSKTAFDGLSNSHLRYNSTIYHKGKVSVLLIEGDESSRRDLPLTWSESSVFRIVYYERLRDLLRKRDEDMLASAATGLPVRASMKKIDTTR